MVSVRRFSILLLAALAVTAARADDPVKRIPLERSDVPGTSLVTVLVRVEAAPGAQLPRHVHPGVEMTTCLSGELDLAIDGQAPRHIAAGEHFQIPAGVPHSITFGKEPAVLVAAFLVEKDKPLAAAP